MPDSKGNISVHEFLSWFDSLEPDKKHAVQATLKLMHRTNINQQAALNIVWFTFHPDEGGLKVKGDKDKGPEGPEGPEGSEGK